jgi:hypothetical protein
VKHANNPEASLRIPKSKATWLNSDELEKNMLSHQQQLMQRNSAHERAENLAFVPTHANADAESTVHHQGNAVNFEGTPEKMARHKRLIRNLHKHNIPM